MTNNRNSNENAQNRKLFTLEQAYEQVVGIRTTFLLTYVNALTRNCGAFFSYCFAYLILEQKYLCSSPDDESSFSECSAAHICEAKERGI